MSFDPGTAQAPAAVRAGAGPDPLSRVFPVAQDPWAESAETMFPGVPAVPAPAPAAGSRGSAAVPSRQPATPAWMRDAATLHRGSQFPDGSPAAPPLPAADIHRTPPPATPRPIYARAVAPVRRPVGPVPTAAAHDRPPRPAPVVRQAAAPPAPQRRRRDGFLRFVGRVLILVLLVLLPAGAALVAYGINNGDPLVDDARDLLERILDLVELGHSADLIDRY